MKGADIFISYRSEDEPAFAGRLFDLLMATFSHHDIFMDEPALVADTAGTAIQLVDKCSVFLLVIGPRWLYAEPHSLPPKLFYTEDSIRREIEAALRQTCLIVPVLVDNTPMPPPNALPPPISKLSNLNALRLTHPRFHDDARPLIKAIKSVIKHPTHKHLTIGEVEAYELGKSLGKELMNRIAKAVQVTAEAMGTSMLEKFVPVAQAAIAQRDATTLYVNIAAFRDAVGDVKSELVRGTMEYMSHDLHPIIGPHEPHDELFLKIQEQVQNEFDDWFSAVLERVMRFIVKEVEQTGWQPQIGIT